MRILDKYIVKNFLTAFFYCLVLFISIYIIIDLFEHLDEILKHSVPILILQEYYLSMIPFIIMYTSPLASLIASIYAIGIMNKHDELTAMRAAGINIFRIFAPFVCMGLIISITVFAISDRLLPLGMKNAQFIKTNYFERNKQDKATNKKMINNIALYGKDNRLIFIKALDPNDDTARGITILRQDKNGHVTQKTNAAGGRWTGTTWVLSNVLIYELDDRGLIKGKPLFFKEKELDIENPQGLISKGTDYEFMSFRHLRAYIGNFANASPDIRRQLTVDLHQKVSFPFTSLVLIIIGVAFAVKTRRRGKAAAIAGMGMSLVIGFIYYTVMGISLAFGKAGLLPGALSAYLANIIFGTIGIMSIKN